MTRYLRIRAADGTPICDITDQGVEILSLSLSHLALAVQTLAEHVRGFHTATDGSKSALAAENQRLRDRVVELEGAE